MTGVRAGSATGAGMALLLSGLFLVAAYSTAYATCGTTATATAGATSIQGAVNAAPATLTLGDHCVTVGAGTYNEQVTIQGINTNGFRIIISSAAGANVVISTNTGPAVFNVNNDSVSISGITVQATSATTYGIWVSSRYAVLSQDYVTNSSGVAVYLGGPTTVSNNLISLTTITSNNSVYGGALRLYGATSNTIAGSYVSNPLGYGAELDWGASSNTITQSTVTSNAAGASAIDIGPDGPPASNLNSITQCNLYNPSGVALRLDGFATNTTVCLSTLNGATTNYGPGCPASVSSSSFTGVSSITLTANWASTFPSGTLYFAQLSTGAFPNNFSGNASSNTYNQFATFAGLAASSTYYAQVSTTLTGTFVYLGSTMTLPALPGTPGTPTGAPLGVSSISWTWATAPGATSYQVFRASTPTTLIGATTTNSLLDAGLSTNAAYGIVVQGINGTGAGPLSASATSFTFAMPPVGSVVTAVTSSGVSMAWSTNSNPSSTAFEVSFSSVDAFFSGPAISTAPMVNSSFTTIGGLQPKSTYYFRLRAINLGGIPTAFDATVSTKTLPPPPGSPGPPQPTVLGVSSISWSWFLASDAVFYRIYAASGGLVGTVSVPPFTLAALSTDVAYGLQVQGVNATGTGSLSVAATAFTAADVPANLALAALSSNTASLAWSSATNPSAAYFELQASSGGPFTTVSSAAVTAATASGLTPSTTYTFRVRAYNGDGLPTAFAAPLSTTTLPPPPGQPGPPSGSALGTSSISWTWAAASGATAYAVSPATAPGATLAIVSTVAFTQTGLPPNATASILVTPFDASGSGPPSSTATARYTAAYAPTGSAASAVYVTSATVSWSLGLNPTYTIAQVQLSSDGVNYNQVFSSAAISFTDAGLLGCTTYTFRVRNVNGDGLPTAFDATVLFATQGSTPAAPVGLAAQSLAGDQIGLSWSPAPSANVTSYRLYWDSGTGNIDYTAPLAVLTSTESAYTTRVLTSSAAYRFGLRATNSCGVEEKNTDRVASAAALASLSGVRAAIVIPQTGQTVQGNRLTVVARVILGNDAQASQVRFQYKASSASTWTDIPAADANHPNPDLAAPWFVHWNVDALAVAASTQFDLRGVAADLQGTTDPAPPAVTITVMPTGNAADIAETLVSGQIQKAQAVSNLAPNLVEAADAGSALVTTVNLPAGALTGSTVTLTVVNNPSAPPAPPSGSAAPGIVTQVALANGQTTLSGGKTAAVTLSYPDADGDGVVDGTTIRADRLVMYSAETAAGPWVRDLGSSVDTAHKTVTGNTTHFSFFALFAPVATSLDTVRVYPNPFVPNGGNADQGAPYNGLPGTGITFDNLPVGATVKIYTLLGQLVADVAAGAGGAVQWDAKNKSGHEVASDLYMAVIKAPGASPVVKKILIVR